MCEYALGWSLGPLPATALTLVGWGVCDCPLFSYSLSLIPQAFSYRPHLWYCCSCHFMGSCLSTAAVQTPPDFWPQLLTPPWTAPSVSFPSMHRGRDLSWDSLTGRAACSIRLTWDAGYSPLALVRSFLIVMCGSLSRTKSQDPDSSSALPLSPDMGKSATKNPPSFNKEPTVPLHSDSRNR